MKLVTVAQVKNEEAILPSALAAWASFSDYILVLDDNSTDSSVAVAAEAGAEVVQNTSSGTWGTEAPLRQQLWDLAHARTEPGDYIFILDADMTPSQSPRDLLDNLTPGSLSFRLYDLWAEYSDGMLMFRHDSMWQGHLHPRTWLVRHTQPPPEGWQWNPRGVHCGHLPLNFPNNGIFFAPIDYSLLHYAYIDNNRRLAKFNQYKAVWNQLSPQERAHAASILDPLPNLKPLRYTPSLTLSTTE